MTDGSPRQGGYITSAEAEVIKLQLTGLTAQEIAEELGLSKAAVDGRIQEAAARNGIERGRELCLLVLRRSWIDVDDIEVHPREGVKRLPTTVRLDGYEKQLLEHLLLGYSQRLSLRLLGLPVRERQQKLRSLYRKLGVKPGHGRVAGALVRGIQLGELHIEMDAPERWALHLTLREAEVIELLLSGWSYEAMMTLDRFAGLSRHNLHQLVRDAAKRHGIGNVMLFLVHALREGWWVLSEITVRSRDPKQKLPEDPVLEDIERQLLEGLMRGQQVQDLRDQLNLSRNTAVRRLAAIYVKLGVEHNNKEAAVVRYLQLHPHILDEPTPSDTPARERGKT